MNQVPFLLNECAACAKELAPNAPRCVRCWTRYCNASCQLEHWSNGHKKQCKKIARGGGAEKFHVDARAADAEAKAVAATDTTHATCYICRSSDGLLVRAGCGCRGTAGAAHVSCLVRLAESEASRGATRGLSWTAWYECHLCDQRFSGFAQLALAWRCWKSYAWSPELNEGPVIITTNLLMTLGNALASNGYMKEALPLLKAQVKYLMQHGDMVRAVGVMDNIATCLGQLGRTDEMIELSKKSFEYSCAVRGPMDERTLQIALNMAGNLLNSDRFEEAETLLREKLPLVRRVLGPEHAWLLNGSKTLCQTLLRKPDHKLDDLKEALEIIQEVYPISSRVLGETHEITRGFLKIDEHCQEIFKGMTIGGVPVEEYMARDEKKET